MIYLILAGVGFGLAAGAFVYLALSGLSSRRAKLFAAVIQPKLSLPKERRWKAPANRISLPAVVAGALGFALLVWDTPLMLPLMPVGGLVGLLGQKLLDRLGSGREHFTKLREVALLYESVDLFTRAGFTVRQALQMSLVMVPKLRRHVEKCLGRWPAGPIRALEQLGADIGIKEADILAGLLMHAEEAGVEKVSGVMEQEAVRLEEIRRTLAEVKIASKPIYLAVYVLLPVATALGMLVGPMAYRAINSINQIRAPGGF